MTRVSSTTLSSATDVCERYTPLIEATVHRLQVPYVLREDARQEGFIGLLEALARYDSRSPVHFSVFARWYVKGAILRRIYTRTQTTETSAENPYAGHWFGAEGYEIDERILEAVQIKTWLTTLPSADALLLRRLYWDDRSTCEVAAEMGVSRRRVNQKHVNLLREGAGVLA